MTHTLHFLSNTSKKNTVAQRNHTQKLSLLKSKYRSKFSPTGFSQGMQHIEFYSDENKAVRDTLNVFAMACDI